jgi:hypothetical protein
MQNQDTWPRKPHYAGLLGAGISAVLPTIHFTLISFSFTN